MYNLISRFKVIGHTHDSLNPDLCKHEETNQVFDHFIEKKIPTCTLKSNFWVCGGFRRVSC